MSVSIHAFSKKIKKQEFGSIINTINKFSQITCEEAPCQVKIKIRGMSFRLVEHVPEDVV